MTMDAVQLTGVAKRRDAFALRGIDLRIPTGYVTGLVGPNGAGKTTLIKAILGLLHPDAGEVTVFGHGTDDARGIHDRVGVVLDRVTASAEWRVGAVGKRIGKLYQRWDERYFQELLVRFGVPASNRVDALSRGQSVKLSLAMALSHRPELLVLDEPSSGLDPVARRELADTIREFMIDPGHTVLFSTHITSELDNLADHIIVLNAGEVAYSGTLDELHDEFAIVRGPAPFPEAARASTIGLLLQSDGGYEGLIRVSDTSAFGGETIIEPATIDDVVIHFTQNVRRSTPPSTKETITE